MKQANVLEGLGVQPTKKKGPSSPLLDRVLNGNSSVCLKVLANFSLANPKLFLADSLNRTIIFKYPNFSAPPTAEGLAGPNAAGDAAGAAPRPIETAIFVPYDSAAPEAGGHGIYLRQRNYKELMLRHLGIDLDHLSEEGARDLKVLDEIDRIPSLDPFLLKSAVQRVYPTVDERYFLISEEEASSTRANIAAKVQPIIERALKDIPLGERAKHTNKFLAALWDPTLPEAELFISAFGIDRGGATGIFEALKGVSFYQWNINSQREGLTKAVKWLQSPNSVPHDMRQHLHMKESVDMFRTRTLKSIRQVSKLVTEIFREFELAHQTFLLDGNPLPFRTFLEHANERYWVLGYSSTALSQVSHLFNNAMRRSYKERISLEQLNELLSLMNMTMASQGSQS